MIIALHPQTDELLEELTNNGDRLFWDDVRTQEVNGAHTFEFTMLADSSAAQHFDQRGRFLAPAKNGGWHEYVIYDTETIYSSNEKFVYGIATYPELNKQKIMTPRKYNNWTLDQFSNHILQNTEWNAGKVEYSGTASLNVEQFMGAYDLLVLAQKAFTDAFEFNFRVEVDGNRVSGRYVDFVERLGSNNAKELVAGKDIVEMKRRVLSDRIITALFVVGPEPEEGQVRYTTTITDDAAFQRWNRDGRHIMDVFEITETETDSQGNDIPMGSARINALGRAELDRRIAAIIEYEITAAYLGHLYPYEDVSLGDTFRVINTDMEPPLYAEARAIAVAESISNPSLNTYTIGEIIEYEERDILAAFRNMQKVYGTRVVTQVNPPEPNVNIIWIKPAEDITKPNVAHVYDSQLGKWVAITPTEAFHVDADPAGAAAAALEDAKADATAKAEAAKQAALDAQEAELALAEERARAYADGVVSDEEAARIAQAEANLQAAKEDATKKANDAQGAAYIYADTAAEAARDAALASANAESALAEERARAYADGIVDDEEAARIAQAQATLAAAQVAASEAATAAQAAAKLYTDTLRTDLEAQIGDLEDALSNFETIIDSSFKDGIIQEVEALTIEKYRNTLNAEKADLDNRYSGIHGDSSLTGAPKTNLASAKTAYNNAHTNLLSTIASAIADGKTTTTEKQAVDAAFETYHGALGTLVTRFEEAVKAITAAKDAVVKADSLLNSEKERLTAIRRIFTSANSSLTLEYDLLDGNTHLEGTTARTNLDAAHSAYEAAYSAFIANIDAAIADTSITTAERAATLAATNNLETKQADFTRRLTAAQQIVAEEQALEAKQLAEQAEQAAADALEKADTALTDIVNKVDKSTYDDRVAELQAAITAGETASESLSIEARDAAIAAAKTYADGIRTELNTSVGSVSTALTNFQSVVTGTFKDGIIQEAEAQAIEKYKNIITTDKLELDNQYTKVYADSALTGTPKTNLKTAKDAYNTAHTNLLTSINSAIADGKTTETEKTDVDTKFAAYRTALGTLSTRLEEAITATTNKKTADAQAAAIAAAAIDAQTKATAAKDAAIAAANTKAEAEREIAKAYADGIVDDEEAARITAIGEALNTAAADAATKANAAATAAQEYADIAVGEAKTAADAEAARLADAALLAAQEYADTAAGTAEQAAILHANTKAEAERVLAEAYADGIVDDEEAARIADVNAKLAAAKTHADNAVAAVLASAKAYADEAAEAAQTAAEGVSLAEVALAEERAKAYADGIVDDEEAARIAQAAANLTAAQTHATNAANTALSSAKTYADSAADAAESAAIAAANTKAEAEREIAKAYADGLIDDEEAARIAAIGTALNTAAEDAATKAQAAAEAAQNYADIAVGEAKEAANTEAQRLANLALTSAKTYADTAATTAETAAKTHADAKAEAERVLAEAYADGLIDDEEEARIAAVNAALATARTDATTKANTALASAKTYADTAATAAKNAAITAANTKAEAEREIAKAYADGIVDDEEEARIAAINANLAAAKTYADSTAATALASSKTYADTAAANAKTAAETAANAETALAETRAKAYADGIVDDEEEARIAALEATLDAAKADATSKANAAETAAKSYSDAIRTDLMAAVGDIEDALDLFEVDVTGAFKDGIIQQVEAKSIEKYKNTLDTEKLDFDNRYTKVYADTKLTGTPKTNLKSAKDAYNSAHSALISSINTAIADGKATAAEATDVNTKFTAYRTALGTLSTRIEEAITATVNKKAADAQAAAITAAATDAATKANAARDAAIAAANTKAEAEREIAKAYADGIVDDEEAARIAAVTAAANAAALDATSKADAALAASKTYAETTATAAKDAAITAANAKAEAERVLAEAYADGIVDDEEAARIADVNAKLAAAKTYADTKKAEAISAAATHADAAATNAKNAAITAANTKAEAEREIAKAYADGIVSDEEDARITAVSNALIAAAEDAKNKADAAALAAQLHADEVLANLEFDTANLLKDSKEKSVTPRYLEVSGAAANFNYASFAWNTVPEDLGTYTLSMLVEFTEGESEYVSVYLTHGNGQPSSSQTHIPYIDSTTRIYATGTVREGYTQPPNVLVYAGRSGSTSGNAITVREVKLEKGTKPTSWTPAPEDLTAEAARLAGLAETAAKNYADAMKLALEQDIATVNTALTNFQTTVTGSFKDGVIQEAEAKSIEKYKNLLTAEKLDLDNRYTKMYGDAALTGTPKTNLKSAKDAYNTAHTNLINSINTAIADGKTTATEKADVDAKFTSYRTALGTLSTRFEEASLAISTKKATDAKSEAIAAGLKMEDVNNALDGYVRTTTYTSDKNGLIQSINQNATAITQTDAQVALRATTAQFNALTQTVSDNTAAITVVSDAISLKADAESITVLQDNLEGVTNAVQTSEIRLNEVETLIQPGSIVDTVTNSVRFELMLGEKANAEDLAGYATQEALNGIIGEVDALGNEISGIEFGEFVTQAEVDQRDNAILTTISASSGVNLIKNSVGLAGLTYWLVTGNGEVSPTSSVDLTSLGYHSGFQFDSTGTGNLTLKQDVAVMQGRPYTLSYSMQAQNSVGEMIVRVVDSVTGAVIDTGPSEIENYAGFGDYSFTIAEMPTTQITIEIIAPQGKQAIITAVMLNIGEVPFSWTTAVGELYNTTIKMDLQGLRVSQLEEDAEVGFTVMTPSKFAGYYNPAGNINESAGSSDEVFRMDKDEFVMKKANVKEEITMGNIKAILINSTARNGWAFVPNTTN